MKRLVLLSSRTDPQIRQTALKLATGLDSTGPVDAAQIIEQFIRNVYTIIDEPEELLVDPTVQMMELQRSGTIHGDCDDVAMLSACLLYMIGVNVRFKAVSSNPDGSFQHVFTEYRLLDTDRWIPVDPTIEGIPVYAPGDFITCEL